MAQINFSSFILLLVSCIFSIQSEGLKMTLIPPNSPDSPGYLGNLSMSKKIQNLVSQSKGRVQVLNTRAFPTRNSNQTLSYGEPTLRTPVYGTDLGGVSGYVYSAKIGIGTFDEEPHFKTYYLGIDTGSVLTWLQCEECQTAGNTCFPQADTLFQKSLSRSYDPLPDGSEMCYQPTPPNPDNLCYYNVEYEDGARSYGQMAYEDFTFEADSPSTVVASLMFGCGFNQTGFTVSQGEPENTAGILGLGRGKQAFHFQLAFYGQVGLSFSYCFQDLLNQGNVPQPTTYLRFGEDITGDHSTFQQTPFQVVSPSSPLYYVSLTGLAVGDTDTLTSPLDRVILDSGSSVTHLVRPVFELLSDTLVNWLYSNLNAPKILQTDDLTDDPTFCFVKRPDQGYEILPTIYFLLEGDAELEIRPEQGFVVWQDDLLGPEYFCLMIEPHDALTVIGAFQMVNHRFIYDTRENMLLFKNEDCTMNP